MLPIGNRSEISSFLSNIEVRRINGIGKITSTLLKAIDIHTCADLLHNRALLYLLEYPGTFQFLMQVALGYDDISFHAREDLDFSRHRTTGQEMTFTSTSSMPQLLNVIKDLCNSLENDLKSKDNLAIKIILKLKTSHFETKTKTRTLSKPSNDSQIFLKTSVQMLNEFKSTISSDGVRLLGVRAVLKQAIITSDNNGSILRYLTSNECGHMHPSNKDDLSKVHQDESLNSDRLMVKSEVINSFEDNNNGNMCLACCPICFTFQFDDLNVRDINAHIDECLTLEALKREETTKIKPIKLRQTTLDNLFSKRKH
ncbi:hypothetical protein GJ496_008907 [Pomphorhynchus laevis]|nr:hypothetical protein GJ496_008907 [Pomphorhynchus laevis]